MFENVYHMYGVFVFENKMRPDAQKQDLTPYPQLQNVYLKRLIAQTRRAPQPRNHSNPVSNKENPGVPTNHLNQTSMNSYNKITVHNDDRVI